MLKEILENMSIYIEEESMIAGNQASSNKDAPIFPEYTLEFVLNELDLLKSVMEMFSILQKKQKNNLEVLLRFGKIIIYVLELVPYYLKKCLFIWKQDSSVWKVR